MNLFYLDKDLKKCAEYHIDAHCNKMILEAAQMLCTAVNLNGGTTEYKTTHVNHPTSVWVRQSVYNFIWTFEYGYELCKEYTYRTGKMHKTQVVLENCSWKYNYLPKIESTPFVLSMPDQYKTNCPIESYRNYYLSEKRYNKNGKNMFKWTKREVPHWVIDANIQNYIENRYL